MSTRNTLIVILILWVLSLAVAGFIYPRLGERVAIHWNARGEVDGYGSPFMGSFFLPLVAGGISLMLLFIPAIDPLKKNIERFRTTYNGFILFFMFFMLYLFGMTVLVNFGYRVNMNYALIPAYAALNFIAGILVAKAQPNWFIGIRTPWTLSNETVWFETHRRTSRLFKLAALVTLLGFLAVDYAIFFLLAPLMLVAVYAVLYSYLAYRRLQRLDS